MAHSTGDVLVGVDAGASKTHALACTVDGRVLGFGVAGGANWEGVGLEGAELALRTAVDGALATAGASPADVRATGYGLAGLDWPSDRPLLERVVDALGLAGPRVALNDAFIALRAGCHAPFGIVSSAGTGSVSAGRNRAGETFRTMAIGYGERGGGGELVDAALHAIALSYHGSGPATALTGAILERAGAESVADLFEGLTRREQVLPDGLPRLVLELADAGDESAAEIASDFGGELAAAAAGVARRLGMTRDRFELVRSGGVHLAGCRTLDERFRECISAELPGATLVSLTAPPAIGAILIAMELIGAVEPGVQDRLATEATRAAAMSAELP